MMGVNQSKPVDTGLFDCLAAEQRRAVVAVLADASGALSVRELAGRTVARLDGTEPDAVADAERDRMVVTLHHRDLPKLADVEIVEYDREEERVETTDHPAFGRPGIREAIESPTRPSLDRLFEALADVRRQRLLLVLEAADGPVDIRDAATRLAADRLDDAADEVPPQVVERVTADIWHVHLGKLRDAGLVTYDGDAETVSYESHPDLQSAWLRSGAGRRAVDA